MPFAFGAGVKVSTPVEEIAGAVENSGARTVLSFVTTKVGVCELSFGPALTFVASANCVLYQGGTDLAFDKPQIKREMIVIIQGLVILFAGALEHMFRPHITRLVRRWNPQVSEA